MGAARKRRYVNWAIAGAIVLVLAAVAWLAYRAISTSVRAEYALHAVCLVTMVTDDFVEQHGRWPRSWADLETVSTVEGWAMYSWPCDSAEVQRYVYVDFDADLATIASQTIDQFDAIRPIGPYYPYKKYGVVASLIDTTREVTGGKQQSGRKAAPRRANQSL